MSSSAFAQEEGYDRTTTRAFLGGTPHQETEFKNATVTYKKQANGQYIVLATWFPLKDATSYAIETSINGGPYRHATTVNAHTTSLAFKHVKQGMTIAVRVTATRSNGEMLTTVERETRLPNSGLSMLSLTCIAGAVAGARLVRRKEQALA